MMSSGGKDLPGDIGFLSVSVAFAQGECHARVGTGKGIRVDRRKRTRLSPDLYRSLVLGGFKAR